MPLFGPYKCFYKNVEDLSKNCEGFSNYATLLKCHKPEGWCYGILHAWGFAYFASDETTYLKRIKILSNDFNKPVSAWPLELQKLTGLLVPDKKNSIRLSDLINAAINKVQSDRKLINYFINHKAYPHRISEDISKIIDLYSGLQENELLRAPESERVKLIESYRLYSNECYVLKQLVNNYTDNKWDGFDLLISVRAFLDRLLLLQTPHSTQLRFCDGKSIFHRQDVLKASKYLIETKADTTSGLKENIQRCSKTLFTGNSSDFSIMVGTLINSANKLKIPYYIAITNTDHTIGVTYSDKKCKILDANYLSSQNTPLHEFATTDSSLISRSLLHSLKKPQLMSFCIELYIPPMTTAADFKPLRQLMTRKSLDFFHQNFTYNISLCKQNGSYTPYFQRARITSSALSNNYDLNSLKKYVQQEKNILEGKTVTGSKQLQYKNNITNNNLLTDNYYNMINQGSAVLEAISNNEKTKVSAAEYADYIIMNKLHQRTDILIICCKEDQVELLHQIITKGNINVNSIIRGHLLLLYTIRARSNNVLKYLLTEQKVSVDSIILKDYTPLYSAVNLRFYNGAETLLKKGAKPDVLCSGITALHYACGNGYPNIAELLIKYGANINAKTQDNGSTPLHYACILGHSDIVKLLLKYNACKSIKNIEGRTALDIATTQKFSKLVDMLS
ncbi:MAG: ankyrin repeat domain-containing protein [Lentisphaerae bacterium]|nr:ankyrin repeat domain-containing protein [Lentisphaerota bacterium]MCP4101348.1 ankyrin repeat domain-containing protein [Lentisphaerota bacterium]